MNDAESELLVTAQKTCLACDGVSRMTSRYSSAVDGTLKGIGLDSGIKGVRMSREKSGLIFDLYLRVKYGEKIPVLAWNIQKSVSDALKGITDDKIKEVNIHIQGVDI